MKSALTLVGCALLFACGCGEATPEGAGSVGFDLYVSAAAIDEIGGFQLLLVKPNKFADCTSITQTCIKDQVTPADLAQFEDASGNKVSALFVSNDLSTTGTVRTQDTTLRNVPAGKDYFLIVEALSKQDPPKLLGASCTQRVEVRSGTNERLQAAPIVYFSEPSDGGMSDAGLGVDCDPRF